MDATEVPPTPTEAQTGSSLEEQLGTILQNRAFQLIVFFAAAVVCAVAALLDMWVGFRVFFLIAAATSTASFVVTLTDDGEEPIVTDF